MSNNDYMKQNIQRMLAGEIPFAPIAKLLGIKLISMVPGESLFEFQAGPSHANPLGTLHGGVLCDLADLAMGSVYAASLNAGESFTTLELKINFLKPVWQDKLTARGFMVKRGSLVGLVECEITDSAGRLVAKATSTCLTLTGDRAQGR